MNENYKIRTRSHVIADLSINHVERVALRAGFSVERVRADYGVDLILNTYGARGEAQPGYVRMQVKATDTLNLVQNESEISVPVEARDLNLWLKEVYPFVLVVYDGRRDRAYWLMIQSYFQSLKERDRTRAIGNYLNLRLTTKNRLDVKSMMKFAVVKGKIVAHRQEDALYGTETD